MIRNLLLTFWLVLTANLLAFSQSGTLKGKVIDKETKEAIPFVNIIVELGGTQAGGTTSDFDGNFTIKPITPGKYDLKATYVGFKPVLIKGLQIKSDQITFQDISMESTMVELTEFEVIDYKVPLIDADKTSVGATVTSEEIAKMPNRSANAIATTVGGVFSADGERGSVRGQRSDGTVMYIDGIRVRGSSSLPESAIEQVSVILSGVPAQYGDATGGIINVTTKGPSREFGAGIELQTSEFLDAYGYNRAGLNMQGPLLWSKDEQGNKKSSLLGYFIAGEITYNKDSRPTATGIYKVKDDVLRELEYNPIRLNGNEGIALNTNFIHKDQLELVKATPNTESIDVSGSGKLDIKTGPNVNLSLGGSINYSNGRLFDFSQSMFNYDKNTQVIANTWRVFGRFTQRFPTDPESKSFIKNVYYTLQADYTKSTQIVQDPYHKDDLFRYGYLGKYETSKERSYTELPAYDSISGKTAFLHNGFRDTEIVFTPFDDNPLLANYTRQYYELYPSVDAHSNLNDIIRGGGLLNGMGADGAYGLWGAPGGLHYNSNYQNSDNEQYALNASASADIGNHALQFGFIYEQRVDRFYTYSPTGLWDLMRGLTNSHIEQLDLSNPQEVTLDGVFMDTIYYNRKYDALSQRYFDISMREKLGLPIDGTDWVDIDSYDINNYTINYYDAQGNLVTKALDQAISIDMFSPDELFNDGNYLANYSGYTYTGEKIKMSESPSFDDFFTKQDENGMYTREIAPFAPIYMAGFIQDKFAFEDLIFNIGLRVDRFDANQKVLTDPYLLYPSKTVSEVSDLGSHPDNMGDDYVVYVDNRVNPTSIMGYRDGDNWFNAQGLVTTDPSSALDAGNGVIPYLEDWNEVVTSKSFSDYEPQISVMPRVSFSFPISDEALFFAHYDVLTQRPTYALRMSPLSYYFMPRQGSPDINNPNLKPEKTIDYELGFQQRLSASSSMTISAYYREIRDQIQAFRYTAAYPKTYYSYNNIDFSTVKGVTVSYDMRRTTNARVRASYTLQFANGTGSDPEFAKGLIQTGQPNLRTLFPMSFDRRHALNLMLDYRYGEGKEYNGPVIRRTKTDASGKEVVKSIQLLQNTGVNFTIFGGSGTPYTKSSRIVAIGGTGQIDGSINGSRLPWQFRIDGRIDKDINIQWNENRASYLNVYLQVLNILDAKNIMGVYSATGNPDDDGYLAAAEYQKQIQDQLDEQAYRDLYSIRINTPGNYSSPRQIRLGLIFNF